ncbi:MAG: hypothetical protein ACREF8_01985, partial [Chthoniobacterales bacterium]
WGLSLFILLGQVALILRSILLGDLKTFFIAVGLGVVAFLLLFFIWIGHNWPRWVLAPLFACSGFANVIWGMTEKSGPLFLLGLLGLTIFTYLALAPSVYAFARRQRERVSLTEALVIGGVLLLMLASVGCGLYGFYVYDTDLQGEATRFAETTFNKVFLYHDVDFLRANLKDEEREMSPQGFLDSIGAFLGQPRWVGKPRGVFVTHFSRDRLTMTGRFRMPALFNDNTVPIWINIDVSRIGDGWQIDHIGWEYQPRKFESAK